MPSMIKTKLELHARCAAAAVCAAVLAHPAGAQQEGLTVEVGQCVDLPTPEQRLACFEAQVEAARRARESSGAAPAPDSEPAARAEPAPSSAQDRAAGARPAVRAEPAARSVEPAPRAAETAPPAPRAAEAAPRAAESAPRTAEPVPPAAPPAAPATAEPAPRVVEARVRPEPQRTASEQGATAGEDRGVSRRQQERAERLANPEIFATVAELRETVPNSYLITLDNGQVWRQTVPMAYGLREGAEVHLYPSRWGDSYRLTDEDLRGYIQVERVR